MPYLAIDEFSNGLDTRKSPLTAPPGSLTRLTNAVVTPGGEISKRRAFKKVATLTGTFGLAAVGSELVAFSRNQDLQLPAFMVPGVSLRYDKLPTSSQTIKLISYDVFDGNLYLACFDANGTTPQTLNPHFYNKMLTEGSGKGYYVRSYQSKVYCVNDKYVFFSAIKDPRFWEEPAPIPPDGSTVVSTLPAMGVENEVVLIIETRKQYVWTSTSGIGSWKYQAPSAQVLAWIDEYNQRIGSGYINVALQESGGRGLQGLEIYYDKLALISNETAQLWAMDPDPNQNSISQVLRATGTRAPLSVQQYGSGDVLFLSSSGIRSLKARDSSNSAAVTDIGSPIDNYIRDLLVQYGDSYLANGQAILEPVVGRFWLVFPTSILVLSYFPGPKITAWSIFTLPFVVDYVVTAGDRIFIRSGDDLYCYGGVSGTETENCGVDVRFPYLDAKKPGTDKMFQAFDATVQGTWRIAVSYSYNDQEAEEQLGFASSPTWRYGRFAMEGVSTHVSMRFYNEDDEAALIANCAIHYDEMGTLTQ